MFRRCCRSWIAQSLGRAKCLRASRSRGLLSANCQWRSFAGPKAARRSDLKVISSADIDKFKEVLNFAENPNSVLQAADSDLSTYNGDWLQKYRGASELVLRPKSTSEVSAILSHCNAQRIGVSVQGGNTGLVGGSVPLFDEVILSLSRMTGIVSFDEQSSIVTCEAGCVLENVDNWLRQEHAHIFPLDLGAKGSCQLGGNVSTNAGGLRLVRYGGLHGSVMGVEAVVADGTVLDLTTATSIKDNTGLDLKQLFIGAEGALAVVTKVSVLCPAKPKAENVLFLALQSFDDVLKVKQLAKHYLNEILSAVEFLDKESISYPIDHLSAKFPLSGSPSDSPFYMVIETHGSNEAHDREKLEALVETLFDKELVTDGTMAEDLTQFGQIWELREGVVPAIAHGGLANHKYDISLPWEHMYAVVEECRERIAEHFEEDQEFEVLGYGHLGDGNLHLNVIMKEFCPEMEAILEPWIYERCRDLKGSISAEHGIGQMKADMLNYTKPETAISYMKKIKAVFDPNHILNPYKVIPY